MTSVRHSLSLKVVCSVLLTLLICVAGCVEEETSEDTMNEDFDLYSWIRDGANVQVARVVQMDAKPGAPGQEEVTLQLRPEEILWGLSAEGDKTCRFERPASEGARLKFPDPVWGRVELRQGVLILMVDQTPENEMLSPTYVDQIDDPNDAVLAAIRRVTDAEKRDEVGEARRNRYLNNLADGQIVEQLFATKALSHDSEGLENDSSAQIALAFANIFRSGGDVYLRLTVGSYMWDMVADNTSATGQVAIINATVVAASDPDEDVRQMALDYLSEIDPDNPALPEITKNALAAQALRDRLALEDEYEAKRRLEKIIAILE